MGLTKADVDKAKYDPEGKTWQVVMDDELKGFGLRLLGSGQKSFIVRYRNAEGKTRILTLGR